MKFYNSIGFTTTITLLGVSLQNTHTHTHKTGCNAHCTKYKQTLIWLLLLSNASCCDHFQPKKVVNCLKNFL